MNRKSLAIFFGIAVLVTAVYSNHFENAFHFDDFHTIVQNPYITDIHNLPRFFVDTDTTSVLPPNRVWRPLVFCSFAIDYWLGHGLKPLYFHLSTFFWFLVLLALMFALFRKVFAQAGVDEAWAAGFATALFALNPAVAETINYVIQRSELYSGAGRGCEPGGLGLCAGHAEIRALSVAVRCGHALEAAGDGVSDHSIPLHVAGGWRRSEDRAAAFDSGSVDYGGSGVDDGGDDAEDVCARGGLGVRVQDHAADRHLSLFSNLLHTNGTYGGYRPRGFPQHFRRGRAVWICLPCGADLCSVSRGAEARNAPDRVWIFLVPADCLANLCVSAGRSGK